MSTSRSLRRRALAAGTLLAVLAAAGCAAESEPDAAADESATASQSPSATPSEAPSAADGTDYAVCEQGECEVELSERVEFVFDMPDGELTLAVLPTDEGIEWATSSGPYSGGGSMTAGCIAVVSRNGGGPTCYGAGTPDPPEPSAGTIVMEVLDVTDGTVILYMNWR